MKPAMTECDKKFMTQPRFKMPTPVYRHPAMKATCKSTRSVCSTAYNVIGQLSNHNAATVA